MRTIKRSISLVSLYLFILILIPMSVISKQVQAFESEDEYWYSDKIEFNEQNHWIGNKYNITGTVLKVQQYKDCTIIVTTNDMYVIKDGTERKIFLGKVSLNCNIIKKGTEIYFTPYCDDTGYNLLKINLDDNTQEVISLKKMNFNNNYLLQEASKDNYGNDWFSVLEFNNDIDYESSKNRVYKLLRLDGTGNVMEIAQVSDSVNINYDEAFTNISCDSKNNIWFEVSERNVLTSEYKYKLERISMDGGIKYIEFKSAITDYKVNENGEIWLLQGNNTIINLDRDGIIIKAISTKDCKDIDIDKDGGIWILDENKIKKLEGDKFISKYTGIYNMNKLSVYDNKKIVTSSNRGIYIVDGTHIENISTDNYVMNNAVVIKDNNGYVKILSNQLDDREHNIQNDRLNLLCFDQNSSEFQSFEDDNIYNLNLARTYSKDIYSARDIYIPFFNTIYKLNRAEIKQFAVLFDKEDYDEHIINMEIGSNGKIYTITNKNVYETDNNGKTKAIDINRIAKNKNIEASKSLCNILKTNRGEIYTSVKLGNNLLLYNVTDFDNIKEESNYLLENNRIKYFPCNVFINEDEELEFVFFINNEFKIYKKSNDLLVEDIRFINQTVKFEDLYKSIASVKKSAAGNLFVLTNSGILFVKEKNVENFHEYEDGYYDYNINSIETDNSGAVYIGTRGYGAIYYNIKSETYKELPAKYDVPNNKVWHIKCSKELNTITLNTNNIFVQNELGDTISIKISYDKNNNSIVITPFLNYKAGETYYLFIRNKIKSIDDSELPSSIRIKFTISQNLDVIDVN